MFNNAMGDEMPPSAFQSLKFTRRFGRMWASAPTKFTQRTTIGRPCNNM